MTRKYSVTLTLRDTDYTFCDIFRDDLRSVYEYLYRKLCLGNGEEIVGILIEEWKDN